MRKFHLRHYGLWRYYGYRIAPVVAYVILALAVGYVFFQQDRRDEEIEKTARAAQEATTKLSEETVARRDQTCLIFERYHVTQTNRLKNTYDFLLQGDPNDALYKTLIRLLPRTEEDARNSRPPTYCDPPEVGLKDPPLPFPVRPESLDESP